MVPTTSSVLRTVPAATSSQHKAGQAQDHVGACKRCWGWWDGGRGAGRPARGLDGSSAHARHCANSLAGGTTDKMQTDLHEDCAQILCRLLCPDPQPCRRGVPTAARRRGWRSMRRRCASLGTSPSSTRPTTSRRAQNCNFSVAVHWGNIRVDSSCAAVPKAAQSGSA